MRDFLRGFREGMRLFGEGISVLVNSALLSLVYLVGVGLTAAGARAKGKKFLDMGEADCGSFWEDAPEGQDIESYYRQY